MTATQYCADKGLNPSSLYQWSSRLRRDPVDDDDGEPSTVPRFLRVVRDAALRETTSAPIEVVVRGVRVLVRDGFDAHVFGAVVDVLEGRTR